MKGIIILAGMSLLLALGSGCADFNTYIRDRGNDFADCFKGDVGYGFGAGAHVRATDLLSLGAGGGYMWKHGFKGRNAGKWNDLLLGWPASNVVFAFNVIPDMYRGSTTIGNNGSDVVFGIILCIPMNYASVGRLSVETEDDPPRYERDYFKGGYSTHSIFGFNALTLDLEDPDASEGYHGRYRCPPLEKFDIEVGVMAGLVGVHFGFSPGQFADFLLGWFGLDIAGDDAMSTPPEPLPVPASP